jgi:hypothetical protein
MKTAIREMLIEKTVKPISRAPLSAAASGDRPASVWHVMFSITTMASSTTKPLAIVIAIKDRLSRLKPKRYIAAKLPIIDTGTATVGMKVTRAFLKNMKTTMMTRMTEMTNVCSTSDTEARMAHRKRAYEQTNALLGPS